MNCSGRKRKPQPGEGTVEGFPHVCVCSSPTRRDGWSAPELSLSPSFRQVYLEIYLRDHHLKTTRQASTPTPRLSQYNNQRLHGRGPGFCTCKKRRCAISLAHLRNCRFELTLLYFVSEILLQTRPLRRYSVKT